MKIGFAGTPEFAAVALRAIIEAGHQVPLVLTQPDRPAGRGMKLQASPVKQLMQERLAHAELLQPTSLRLDGRFPGEAAEAMATLQAARLDALVVAAYGLILPQWTLDLPRLGCLNIHASLLPRWRGAAPIHRAIEAGDRETGITIMQMDAGLDTGAMLDIDREPVRPDDTTGTLHDRLALRGGQAIVRVLTALTIDGCEPEKQPDDGVVYAQKVTKEETALDFGQDATAIARRIRAFNPSPGMHTKLGQERIKIWQASAIGRDSSEPPGTITAIENGKLLVQCGKGLLCIGEIQKAGGKRQTIGTLSEAHDWIGQQFLDEHTSSSLPP